MVNSNKNDGMMDEDKERKTGFESIGDRIEKLKGDIGTTKQTSRPEVSKPTQEAKSEPAEKSPPEVYSEPIKYKSPFKLSFGKIFWGIVAIVIIASIFSQSTDRKKSDSVPFSPVPQSAPIPAPDSPNFTNDDFVIDGQYRCSQYHHNRAQELKPSLVEKQDIERQQRILDNEGDDLDLLKSQIDADYIDYYSQSSIDHHNLLVHEYNSRLKMFRINANNLQIRIDNYNAQISNYNNYLIANCRKAY